MYRIIDTETFTYINISIRYGINQYMDIFTYIDMIRIGAPLSDGWILGNRVKDPTKILTCQNGLHRVFRNILISKREKGIIPPINIY